MSSISRHLSMARVYGSRKMTAHLRRAGHALNRQPGAPWAQRLRRLMGLEASYPTPPTTTRSPEHKVSPYLLRNLRVGAPHQVGCAAITELPVPPGFVYLMAIMLMASMDGYSRYVQSLCTVAMG